MQSNSSDQLRAWFKAVLPVYPELFNAAHARCGNYDMAEYALRSAILDVWLQGVSAGMGFRERLRAALRREAFEAALSEEGLSAEFTWPGVPSREGDPVLAPLAREDLTLQRQVMLHYGCGLPHRAIARLTGLSPTQVRGELARFESRCRRGLSAQERSRPEAAIARRMKRLLSQPGANLPQPAQMFRAFEAEAGGAPASNRRVSRIVGGALLLLTALLCAGAFWLFAVLVQPVTF